MISTLLQRIFSRTGGCLALLLILASFTGYTEAAELWGPVLADAGPTAVSIGWRDIDNATEGVRFHGKLYTGVSNEDYRLVTLKGLKPDTAYTYTLKRGENQMEFTFRTAPLPGTPFTFVAYGDTRTNHAIHGQIVQSILTRAPRLVLNTGDLISQGSKPADWDAFYTVARSLTGSASYLVVPGNHEQNADYFYKLFPGYRTASNPIDSFAVTYGDMHVIMLNSTRNVTEQREWLDNELTASAGKTPWTVVVFHYPPFSSSARNGDAKMRDEWVPLLEKHHVDLVLLGHDHFYERSEKAGVQYLICGGGGAPLYEPNSKHNAYQIYAEKVYHYLRVDVTPSSMTVNMIRLDGTVGDTFQLTKPVAQRQPSHLIHTGVTP